MQHTLYKYFPLFGFGLIWTSVIYLHQMYLFNLIHVSNDTYIIICSALLSIALGYYCFAIYDKSTDLTNKKTSALEVDKILLAKLVVALSICSALGGFIIMYVIGSKLGGIQVYLEKPLFVRQLFVAIQKGDESVNFLYKIGAYLSNFGFLSTVLGGILFANKGKIRLWGLLPFVTLLFSQLSIMGRFRFVNGLVFFFISYIIFSYYLHPKLRKKRLIEIFSYSITALIVLFALFFFVVKLRSSVGADVLDILSETAYLYLSGGLTALDKFLLSDFHLTYGEHSFRSVFKWLVRFGIWPEEDLAGRYGDFVRVSPSYRINTYTFIQAVYLDFGYIGLYLISFIWGGLTKITVYQAFKNLSITNIVLACIFVFSIYISFFSFYFRSITSLIYWLLVAALIQYFFGAKLFNLNKT